MKETYKKIKKDKLFFEGQLEEFIKSHDCDKYKRK